MCLLDEVKFMTMETAPSYRAPDAKEFYNKTDQLINKYRGDIANIETSWQIIRDPDTNKIIDTKPIWNIKMKTGAEIIAELSAGPKTRNQNNGGRNNGH